MKNIAVLISNKGTGTNFQAIVDAAGSGKIDGRIVVALSSTSKSLGLERAIRNKIPFEVIGWKKYNRIGKSRSDYSKKLALILKDKYKVDVVAMAGWSLILTKEFFDIFRGPVINIHPGILQSKEKILSPAGEILPVNASLMTEDAIKRFLKGDYKYAGSTLHFVSAEIDAGATILHDFEKIKSNDTIDSLYKRLKKKEHKMFVKALQMICSDRLIVEGEEVKVLE